MVRRFRLPVRTGMARRPFRGHEVHEIYRRLAALRRRHLESTRDFARLERLLLLLLDGGYLPYGAGFDDREYDHFNDWGLHRGVNRHTVGVEQPVSGISCREVGAPVVGQGRSRFYGSYADPFGPLDDSEMQ